MILKDNEVQIICIYFKKYLIYQAILKKILNLEKLQKKKTTITTSRPRFHALVLWSTQANL
jgi:hypothetical protein